MNLASVRPGDVIEADRLGRRFMAIVVARRDRGLEVAPIDRRITYHHVKAREVICIWHKSRSRNGRVRGVEERRQAA